MTTATSVQAANATGAKTLRWIYEPFEAASIGTVLKQMTEFMDNSLTPGQTSTAKVDISDAKDTDARGIIYFVENADSAIPKTRVFMANWTNVQHPGADYKTLYDQGLDTINGLTDDQALSCQVGYSNRKGGNAMISIWYGQYPVS